MKRSYLIDNAELMKDWHQELNPGIDPSKLTKGSHVFIKWKCHKCGRIWDAMVKNRMNGDGCTCDAMVRKAASLRKTLVKKHGKLSFLPVGIAVVALTVQESDLVPVKQTLLRYTKKLLKNGIMKKTATCVQSNFYLVVGKK